MQQRESCGCGECGLDKWDGHWPYVQAAYDAKLVVYDDICGDVGFDLNTVAAQQIGTRSGK
jgi:hypothetical protein